VQRLFLLLAAVRLYNLNGGLHGVAAPQLDLLLTVCLPCLFVEAVVEPVAEGRTGQAPRLVLHRRYVILERVLDGGSASHLVAALLALLGRSLLAELDLYA
jgi:hypothetical protein